MLVLVRRAGQSFVMYPSKADSGSEIRVNVVRVGNKSVELGIEAPMSVRVLREEIVQGNKTNRKNGGQNRTPHNGGNKQREGR